MGAIIQQQMDYAHYGVLNKISKEGGENLLRKRKKGSHYKSSHFKGKITASVLAAVIAVSSAVPLMGTAIAASDESEAVGVELETEELGAEAGDEEVAAEADDEEVAADSDDEEVGAEADDDAVGAGSYDSGSGTEVSFSNGPSNFNAGVNPNNNDNGTAANAQGIFWAKATYFDYLSDTEMNSGWLNPIKAGTGHNSSHDEWFPFYGFNRDVIAPMKNGWSKPLYFGNFCNVSGAFDTSAHHDTGLITGNLANYNSWSTATNSTYAPNFNYQANNSNAVADYNTSVQGLMRSTLDDTGRLMTPDGQVAPYFDADKMTQSGYARVVNSSFPFRITEKGSGQAVYDFYEFDSKNARDNVYFTWKNEGGKSVPEYVNYGAYSTYGVKDGLQHFMYQTASGYGIFPFNNASGNYKGNKPSSNENLDYCFGVRIDVKFRVPEGGKWGNEPVMFNFSGDDDLWVYITDDTTKKSHLALDMGGAHKESDGRINFATKKSIVDKVQSGSGKRTDERDLDTIFADSDGFKYDHTYTMSVFYMERGLLESNCKMSFSMIPGGDDFKVTEKINDTNVNPGIKDDVKKLDAFKFTPMTYDTEGGSGAQGVNGSEFTYHSQSGTSTQTTADGTFNLKSGEDADFHKQIDIGKYVGVTQTRVGSSLLKYTTKWSYWDNVYDPNHTESLDEGTKNTENTALDPAKTKNIQLLNRSGSKYDYAELQVDFENTPKTVPVQITKTLANGVSSDAEFPAKIRIKLEDDGNGGRWLTRPLEYTCDGRTYTLQSDGSLSQNCMLKKDRVLTFNGIPQGAILEVTEQKKSGFQYQSASEDNDNLPGNGISPLSANELGNDDDGGFTMDTNYTVKVKIGNKMDEPQGAVIKAKKNLTYNIASKVTFNNTLNWNNVYVYAEDSDGNSLFGDYESKKLTNDGSNLYVVEIPVDAVFFVFHNINESTVDITNTNETERTITPTTYNGSAWEVESDPAPSVTFVNTFDWEEVYFYAMDENGDSVTGDYPGTLMSRSGNSNEYFIDVPTTAKTCCFARNRNAEEVTEDVEVRLGAKYTPKYKDSSGYYKLDIEQLSSKSIRVGDKAFEFGLYKCDDYHYNNERLIQRKFCDSNGDVTFDELTYTVGGDYYYLIREIEPDEKDSDVDTYSKQEFHVKVKAVANQPSEIHYYSDNGYQISTEYPVFNNKIKVGKINVNKSDNLGNKVEGVIFEVYKVNGYGDTNFNDFNRVGEDKTDSDGVAAITNLPIYTSDYKYQTNNSAVVTFNNTKSWNDVYIYIADSRGRSLINDWPGTQMDSIGNGKYQFEVPLEASIIVFNDGQSNETVEISPKKGAVYTPTVMQAGYWNLDSSLEIYFDNSKNWSNVKLFAANKNGDPINGDWPGNNMENVEGTLYKATLPATVDYIVFNEGNSSSSEDVINVFGDAVYTPSDFENGVWKIETSSRTESNIHSQSDYQWYALVEVNPKNNPDTNQNYNPNNQINWFQFPKLGEDNELHYEYTFGYSNVLLKNPDTSGFGMLAVKLTGLGIVLLSGCLFATHSYVRIRRRKKRAVHLITK